MLTGNRTLDIVISVLAGIGYLAFVATLIYGYWPVKKIAR